MGYEEQLIMQANMAKKQQQQGVTERLAEGVVDVGMEVADGLIDMETDGIVEGLLEGADDLPALVIVGIIAGVVAVIGGVIWLVKKAVKTSKKI